MVKRMMRTGVALLAVSSMFAMTALRQMRKLAGMRMADRFK